MRDLFLSLFISLIGNITQHIHIGKINEVKFGNLRVNISRYREVQHNFKRGIVNRWLHMLHSDHRRRCPGRHNDKVGLCDQGRQILHTIYLKVKLICDELGSVSCPVDQCHFFCPQVNQVLTGDFSNLSSTHKEDIFICKVVEGTGGKPDSRIRHGRCPFTQGGLISGPFVCAENILHQTVQLTRQHLLAGGHFIPLLDLLHDLKVSQNLRVEAGCHFEQTSDGAFALQLNAECVDLFQSSVNLGGKQPDELIGCGTQGDQFCPVTGCYRKEAPKAVSTCPADQTTLLMFRKAEFFSDLLRG